MQSSLAVRGDVVMRAIFVALAAACAAAAPASQRSLTFEERMAAQRAIERVYYSHQIGASLPFDEAVPHATLEKKVRTSCQHGCPGSMGHGTLGNSSSGAARAGRACP